MASNTVVLVTGLFTPLCTNFLAFSVRNHLKFRSIPRATVLQKRAMAFDTMILPYPSGKGGSGGPKIHARKRDGSAVLSSNLSVKRWPDFAMAMSMASQNATMAKRVTTSLWTPILN